MKRISIIIGISIVSQLAVAQCKLTATLSTSGNCSGNIDAGLQKAVAEAMVKHYNGKTLSPGDCEQARKYLISLSGSSGGCTVRINAVCGGCAGTAGTVDVLGVDKGGSFYSTTGVDEINNWSKDDAWRRMALDSKYESKEPNTIATGDPAFDNLIESMPYSDEAFSGRMPRGSTHIMTDGKITAIGQPVKGKGVIVPDDFTKKPFDYGLGVWSSDDLKPLNDDLKPVPNGIKTFDEEGWDLWRDGLKLGKNMGMFVYGLGEGVATSTVAAASFLGDANINLWTELYKAKSKIDLDEAYEAPDNILTEAAVYWGGKEYAIVGNVLYNAWNSTVDDFVNLICDAPKDMLKAKAIDEVRNKALTEKVSNKLPKTGKIVDLGNIAVDSYNFGGKLADYYNKRK